MWLSFVLFLSYFRTMVHSTRGELSFFSLANSAFDPVSVPEFRIAEVSHSKTVRDRISFVPRKGPHSRDELSGNAIWCNYNSANAFDTDDTSTYFHMTNNLQVGGWFLKSDFGGELQG